MHLSHVRCRGFRSLQDVEVDLVDYNTLIGKNDSGKSSFLLALQKLLDPKYPLVESDICGVEGHGDECCVEATFENCEHEIARAGQLSIRRSLDRGLEYLGTVPENELLRQMSEGHALRPNLHGDNSLQPDIKEFVSKALTEVCPSGRISSDQAKEIYRRTQKAGHVTLKDGWCGLEEQALSSIVQVVMLTASVRGEEEIQGGGSVLNAVGGFLLREATQGHEGINTALSTLNKEINRVASKGDDDSWVLPKLNDFERILAEEIQRFDGTVTAASQIIPPSVPSVDFGITVEISDEFVKELGRMGHGLRRSVVYAMLRTHRRLKIENKGEAGAPDIVDPLYLFLIEEPELYLHPQAERRRLAELKELAGDTNSQVILCTHSAIFVDLSEYKGIKRFERPDRQATNIIGWSGADLEADMADTISLTSRFNIYRSAMVFADLVILVEGASEQIAIPYVADKMNLTCPDVDVEVVSCNGNANIPPFQTILEGLGIRYVAWMDNETTNDKAEVKKAEKIRTRQFGRIVKTELNWEKMNNLKGSENKIYKSWKHFILEDNEPNEKLQARMIAAYNWEDFE